MKLVEKIKELLDLESRILDLEADKEVNNWTLDKFYKTYQYNHLAEISELMVKIFERLLQEQKIKVSFKYPEILPLSKPFIFCVSDRMLYVDHKNICVGDILDYLQYCNAITMKNRRKEDTQEKVENTETV